MEGQRILKIIENQWPKKLGKGDHYDPVFKLCDAIGILALAAGATLNDLRNQFVPLPGGTRLPVRDFVGYSYTLFGSTLDDIEYANDNLFATPEQISTYMAEFIVATVYHDAAGIERSSSSQPAVLQSGPLSVKFTGPRYDPEEDDEYTVASNQQATHAPPSSSTPPHPLARTNTGRSRP